MKLTRQFFHDENENMSNLSDKTFNMVVYKSKGN